MELEAIQSKGSLTDKAYFALKEKIISLSLKPGQVIIEDDISEKLGISRTPLRSALQKLSFENLVEIIPGKGTCVTELSTKYFLDLFEIREVIEILSVKLASLNRTERDLKEIHKVVEIQNELAFEKDLDRRKYLEVDRKLHVLFAKSSKNPLVENQINMIHEAYNRYVNSVDFKDRAVTIAKEHTLLVDAIVQGDSLRAQSLMKEHIQDIKESILIGMINQKNY